MTIIVCVTDAVLPALDAYAAEHNATHAEAAYTLLKRALGVERFYALQQRCDERGWCTLRRYEYPGEALESQGARESYRVVDIRTGEVVKWPHLRPMHSL
jgi:hypothetical protein